MQTNLLVDEQPSTSPAVQFSGSAFGLVEGEQVQYRWHESGAEWAWTSRARYVVLQCGELVRGARVRLKIPGKVRRGTVQALLPGWGPSPRPVIVLVLLDVPAGLSRGHDRWHETRNYAVDQLEVLRENRNVLPMR